MDKATHDFCIAIYRALMMALTAYKKYLDIKGGKLVKIEETEE